MDCVINGIDYEQQLSDRLVILKWFINGYTRNHLPIRMASNVSKEWLIKYYNVDEEYFKQNGLKKL